MTLPAGVRHEPIDHGAPAGGDTVSAPGERVRLGVVIPTLDEAELLRDLLEDLAALAPDVRIVVADGGSGDATVSVARRAGAQVVRSARGRAAQMNTGAAVLDAPWLLFLHADSRLPSATRAALVRFLDDPPPEEAAHFRFALADGGRFGRVIEVGQRLRERLTGLAYGDQGLLVSRRRFLALGGFPDLAIMEDVEAVRRLRRDGGIVRIDAPLLTSARRYVEEGPLRAWARNALLAIAYRLGVSARRLARWYPPRTTRPATPEAIAQRPSAPVRTVLVFVKAPTPGRVKTRLARDVGAERAAAIYRDMGRQVVDAVRTGPWRTLVYFDPPGAEEAICQWLAVSPETLRPQGPGGLGSRMEAAFDETFGDADRVCIVGTDVPDMDADVIARAFDRLEAGDAPDAVVIPALDGGYVLLAARCPIHALFEGVPWSTSAVMAATRDRARREGIRLAELPPMVDVDVAADLPPGWDPEPSSR